MKGQVAPVHSFSPLQGGVTRSGEGSRTSHQLRLEEALALAPDLDEDLLPGKDAGHENGLTVVQPGQAVPAVHQLFHEDLGADRSLIRGSS